MKITIEDQDHKSVVESGAVTAIEVLQDFIQAMLGAGFQPESVKEALLEKAEEYEM